MTGWLASILKAALVIIAKSLSIQEKTLVGTFSVIMNLPLDLRSSQRSTKMSFMLILCRHAVRSTDAEAGGDPLSEELQAGDLRPDHGRG